MKILVAIKRVIDFNVKIRIKPDNSGVETANVKMSMNPFDEIAIEEAVRLKESGIATEIVVVSIGSQNSQEVLRNALALGADRAILVQTDNEVQSLSAAKILKAIVEQEKPELIILGKQAIDNDNNQTGPMLAALLNWPQGTFASKVQVNAAEKNVTVQREVDGGSETIVLNLPALITTDLRLNQPRYASLPNIMKAKQKPLATMTPEQLNVVIKPHFTTLKVEAPSARRAGVKVANVQELVDKLKNEAKVI